MKSIFKSTLIVSLSIFASRVLGLVRDIVIATLFGASGLTDAFFVAFRIPNLLRRIFAEGAFSSAFTPAFAKKLKRSTYEAKLFAESFFAVLLVSLLLTLFLGELIAPFIVKVVAPGLPEIYLDITIKLLREMFPYIFFVSLVAFYGGILNGFEHFFAPAISTALFNLAIILSAIFLSKKLSVGALAVGVLAGGVLQVLLQLIFLKRFNFLIKPRFKITEDVKRTLKNIIPGIFGFAVRQFSMLIDTVLASFLKAGAISYLYYANRFVQLPLGMFAVGLSQVLLPRLAKKSNEKKNHYKELTTGLLLCSAIIIPASVGLIFFGKPIVDLVFNHGKFTEEALNETYLVLVGYSFGLFFFSIEKIVTNAYYSLDEYKFPVKVSAYTLLFNLFINVIFCFLLGFGVVGLALGTSLTSFLNVLILCYKLEKKGDLIKRVFLMFFNYFVLSIPVAFISFIGTKLYFLSSSFSSKLIVVLATLLIAVISYFIVLILKRDKFILILK
ncbi:murein biosynthesis integral membrane protein MurJ [Desulfurobacterium thermolithotrophum]|uniref:murein biosynthesis integral membrane protein MurJ n=1 Tax=Desulfurobacterium thermolithotrophum TaxID=64160 RepID=UPI0013D34FC1|nr:murein biosynthesis integral membrane protein MurJ [Desulfurobacterium thermolithotrophum]